MKGLSLAAAALVAVTLCVAEKAAPAIFQGKLLDFTEERHGSSGIPGAIVGMGSCVNRDYTVDLGSRIIVLRETTCRPGLNPAIRCIVGQNVQVVTGPSGSSLLKGAHDERIGLVVDRGVMTDVGGSGKPVWLQVFKTVLK